jgi:hypothetical protein
LRVIEATGAIQELSDEDLTALLEHVRQERAKMIEMPLLEDKVTNGKVDAH